MSYGNEDTEIVIAALWRFELRIIQLAIHIRYIDPKNIVQVRYCQNLLVALKRDIKEASARRKAGDERLPRSKREWMHFENALLNAYIALRMKTNSHPIRSKWSSYLKDAQSDISFEIWRIQQQYQGIY